MKPPRQTLEEWLKDGLANALFIAAETKNGENRDGWLDDAGYFAEAIARIEGRKQ